MKRWIIMAIRELVNFVDVIDIPDQIEIHDYEEVDRITRRIWSRAVFAPFYRGTEDQRTAISRGINGAG